MSAVLALPFEQPANPAQVPHRDLLDDLRNESCRCQTRPRLALFEACAMLSENRRQSRDAFRDALLRTLAEGFGRRPVFFEPGSPDVSFDERWLLALIDATRRDDADSVAFLSTSRVAVHARRSLVFLVAGLARHLETV